MDYKFIVFDLDGTLLNDKHELSEASKSEIRRINNLGIKVILATGRHYIDVKGVAEELGLDSYIIGSNGTRTYSPEGQKILSHNLKSSLVKKVLAVDVPAGIHMNIYQDTEWVVFEENEELLGFHSHSGFKYRKLSSVKEVDTKNVSKFYYYSHDRRLLESFEEKLLSEFGEEAEIYFSLSTVVELMPKNISKGIAIKEIMEKEGVNCDEVMAFGDGLNDYEMLNLAGKGVLMGNADPKLIEKLPHLEIIGKNNEDAVAKYLRENIG